MAREFDFPEASNGRPIAPLIWISYAGFERATGENLQTPVREEQSERLRRGLAALDADFPGWLDRIAGTTQDGITVRLRDLEAVTNVESKLRDRGLNDR